MEHRAQSNNLIPETGNVLSSQKMWVSYAWFNKVFVKGILCVVFVS